jgi:hypothetical protein
MSIMSMCEQFITIQTSQAKPTGAEPLDPKDAVKGQKDSLWKSQMSQ